MEVVRRSGLVAFLSLLRTVSVCRHRSSLANYVNGVLIIAVAKRAKARRNQIPTVNGSEGYRGGARKQPLKSQSKNTKPNGHCCLVLA